MTNIAEGLAELRMAADEPVLHPQNYRQGDVDLIAASLERFGQVRPIVIQARTGHVVAGNHTLKAVRQLGWDEVAAVVVDLSDEEAEAYLVADNRASDKAVNDQEALAPILERLMLNGRLEGTGYSPDDVDDLLASMDAMPEVDPGETEAQHAADDGQLAERFANRSQVALRQFVLMYDQDTATEVEQTFRKLERAWGVSGARDVVLEALRRAAADPPVEGLTVEEAERANIVPEETIGVAEPEAVAAAEAADAQAHVTGAPDDVQGVQPQPPNVEPPIGEQDAANARDEAELRGRPVPDVPQA